MNYKKGVEVWLSGGWVFLKRKGRLILFLTNFFKVIIFKFILPLRLCHMFEQKYIFFFLHNSLSENQ